MDHLVQEQIFTHAAMLHNRAAQSVAQKTKMSHDKNPGWLGYIGG